MLKYQLCFTTYGIFTEVKTEEVIIFDSMYFLFMLDGYQINCGAIEIVYVTCNNTLNSVRLFSGKRMSEQRQET